MKRFLVAALVGSLLAGLTAGPALARKRFPKHLDKRSWEAPEDMSWADYKPIPGVDWRSDESDPPKKLRAALILGDFQDQGFRVSETSVDATGQRGLGVDDAADYWVKFLFTDESQNAPIRGHTVNEYWLENSYGLIGVEAQAFGPYTMSGNMYEYGVRDFGTDADCPDGPDGCNGNFDTELVQASLADVTAAQTQFGDFDFRFLLHAGYDESGVWLNYGLMLFPDQEAVTEKFGPKSAPDHRNWATTRYVPWSSFFSAQQIWSHALPGALSTQGESDGPSTYAHELSHILGVLDNYNNPYAENPIRSYSGPWDMLSRGTFNGPGGPWERNIIPPTEGGTMGSHHMLRNKIRMGFTPAAEVFTIPRDVVESSGTIFTTRILQRESPPAVDDPTLYSGIRISMSDDRSSCDSSDSLCDRGNYEYYDVEVVNRQGFDSFTPDHGVLIAKSKTADAAPFIWVIDAFPKDIGLIDYVTAAGEEVPYTIGDYRQLADAAFHVGTAPKTKNSYVDEANGLAFYVLKKEKVEGRLVYTVAVKAPTPGTGEVEITKKGGKISRKRVRKQTFEVANPGVGDLLVRLKVKKKGKVKTRLLNNLLLVPGGGTEMVVVWAKGRGKVKLKAVTL